MDTFIEFLKHIINPQWILNQSIALWLILFIVFAETGLFVGFFLPGDSLLFVTGMYLSEYPMRLTETFQIGIIPVIICISLAGIIGNTTGYWFGRKYGSALFRKKDSLLFRQSHLQAAKDFYDRRGAGMIVIARFLPIIRTFAPIVAGIVQMDARKFTFYNILGGTFWVTSLILAGYFLAKIFPWVGDHLELIIIGIIFITTLPVLITYIKSRLKYAKKEQVNG